jgi:hypothetical protein
MKKSIVVILLVMAAVPLAAKTIRIRGTLAGPYDPPLTVRVGSGPYGDAASRRLGAPDAYGLGKADDGIGGIAIPPSPSQWHSAAVDGNTFVSEAVDAATQPLIVAFDAKKRLCIAEVPVSENTADGATVDVGPLTLLPSARLSIDLELPITDMQMVFLLAIPAAQADERFRAEIGRQLSVLDQIAPRTFDLLATGDLLPLPESGHTVLEALPPLASMRIAITDAAAGVEIVRDVPLSPEATMHVARAELTPKKFALRRIAGKVVGTGDRPVRGATVVVSDFPSRREAVTDPDGRFAMPAVLTGDTANFYIDARRAVPRAPEGTLVRDARVDAGEVFLRMATEETPVIGGASGSTTPVPSPIKVCTANIQYPAIGGRRNPGMTAERWGNIVVHKVDPKAPAINVTAASSGKWLFTWAADPFQVVQGTANGPLNQQNVSLSAPGPSVARTLKFVDGSKKAIANLTVYFASLVGDPDPVTLITDTNGLIKLPCVNVPSLPIVIDDDPYAFDHLVTLTSDVTTLTVPKQIANSGAKSSKRKKKH